jgi:hypothetical protein
VLPVPTPSALIETFALQLVSGTCALAQQLVAFLLAAPEADSVIRRAAFSFGAAALLTILIEVNYHAAGRL